MQTAIRPASIIGYPVIGNLLSFVSDDRMDWMQAMCDKHGEVFRFSLLKQDMYLVNHPELVKDILTKQQSDYSKGSHAFDMVRAVMGDSTFTAMGPNWRRKRRLAQPSFHKNKISNLAEIMTEAIKEMLDKWEVRCTQGETIELTDEMMGLTLTVVVRTLFSTGLSEEEIQTVAKVFKPLLVETDRRIHVPLKWLHRLPLQRNIEYQKNIEALDNIILKIIGERRESSEKPDDLLQMLMDARDEDTGEYLSDTELRDEVMTIFIAGHETTANAMSWLWKILSDREDVRQKVEAEVDKALEGRTPTAKDFPNLPYSLKVFYETMRIYPPVPILIRKVERDNQLGDYAINTNHDVLFCPYLLHRHPDFWEEPEAFKPERFEREEIRKRHPFAYLPFGGGSRICLGNNFALMEAVFITAMTAQRFRLKVLSDVPVEPVFRLTTRPKFGIPIKLERR